MRRLVLYISILWLAVMTVGCELLHHDKVVAMVGESRLLQSELDGVTKGYEGKDSLLVAEKYVEQWVRREVKMQEADRVLAAEMTEVERLVEEYRMSLLTNRLEQRYLSGRLDTMITDKLVEEYFNSHRKDFVMDRTILKGRIVRLPDKYRQSSKLFKLMGAKSAEKQQDFLDLCKKNNFELHTFDSWIDFNEFLSYLPVRKGKNYDYVLSGGGIREMSDADSKYFIEIREVVRKGEPAPLERAKDMVRRLLYNRSRTKMVNMYNDSLYNAALLEGKIRIKTTHNE